MPMTPTTTEMVSRDVTARISIRSRRGGLVDARSSTIVVAASAEMLAVCPLG
jgi:hypothetical protein